MQYEQTTHLEDTHDLGMFTKVTHCYSTDCPTGQSLCHHMAERMWVQHHHWNDKRLGIEQDMTIDAYGWEPVILLLSLIFGPRYTNNRS